MQGLASTLSDFMIIHGDNKKDIDSIRTILNEVTDNLNELYYLMTEEERAVWKVESFDMANYYSDSHVTSNTHAENLLETALDCSNNIINNYDMFEQFPEHLKAPVQNINKIISMHDVPQMISNELSKYN